MKKTVKTATALIFAMTCCFNTAFAAVQTNANSWAVESVTESVELGIMPQSLAYDAISNITREELCILAINFYEKYTGNKATPKEKSPFSDTDFYMIVSAYEMGIIDGVSENKFEPNKNVTREELAVVIYKILKACGIENLSNNYERKFEDGDKISSFAKEGVNAVVSNGIMSGVGNNFNPLDIVTREQTATAFVNTYNITRNRPITINNKELYIGSSKDDVISMFGNPQRIDESIYGYKRYVYNNDYNNLFIIGISNDTVVDVYISGKNSGYDTFKIDSKFSSNGNKYEYNEDINKFILCDNFVNIDIYCDISTGNIYGIKISDKSYDYSRNIDNYTEEVQKSLEMEVLDIINAERVKRGIAPLTFDERLNVSAKNHSIDMVENKYTDYNNKDGKTPFERMNEQGVNFDFAAETISQVSNDVYDILGDVMTVKGKKGNVLSDMMDTAGVGVVNNSFNLYVTIDMYYSK